MAQLNTVVVDNTPFSHSLGRKFLSAEISELRYLPFLRLYDDQREIGFTLRGKEGNLTRWRLVQAHKDRDNDTTHWTFVPTDETVVDNPSLAGYAMVIYND